MIKKLIPTCTFPNLNGASKKIWEGDEFKDELKIKSCTSNQRLLKVLSKYSHTFSLEEKRLRCDNNFFFIMLRI